MRNSLSPNKIEEILNSLEDVRRAEPLPFFYTRVRAKLEAASSTIWERVSTLISKPVIALAGISFILILNLFVIYSHSISLNNNSDQADVTNTEEYSLVTNSFYDTENNKP